MSIRVGIDLVEVSGIQDSLASHGQQYLDRVYSAREVADCTTGSRVDPARLAARFAAKEATLKALQVGDEAVAWTDVEVRRQDGGSVTLSLTGNAATLARREGITELALSLSHERDFATAVVIAEIQQPADT